MPKFIVKPKSTSADPKRQKTESSAVQDNDEAPVAEQKSEPAMQTNVLQSLCQNYDSDDSEWGPSWSHDGTGCDNNWHIV